jgi:hypothetical protein
MYSIDQVAMGVMHFNFVDGLIEFCFWGYIHFFLLVIKM